MENRQFKEEIVTKIEQIDEYFEVKKEEPWLESDFAKNQPLTSSQQVFEPKCEPEVEEQVVLKEEQEEPEDSIEYVQMVAPKKQQSLGARQINANKRKIDAFFLRSQHPSVQTLTELARSFQFSFDEVFEHFEQLRAKHEVPCDSGDVCCRIRDRFLFATTTNEEFARMVLSPDDKKMLLQEFDKFEDEAPFKELDSSDFHLIMENTNIHPFHIKLEFDKYKQRKILMVSHYAFPDDFRYYKTNKHPSIEEMIQISEANQTDYTIVFRRFDQFRHAQKLICTPNDTCYRVRRYLNNTLVPKGVMTSETNELVLQEFEKFEKMGIRELTAGHVHLIRDVVDLHSTEIRREFSVFKKKMASMARTRQQEETKLELQKKFDENPYATRGDFEEISIELGIPTSQVRGFFLRARRNAKKEIYQQIF